MAFSFFNNSLTWNAKWIWLDYITPFGLNSGYKSDRLLWVLPSEKNRWAIFRHTFILQESFKLSNPAILYISVDSRYKLYLNGTYIGRGIYRCNKHNWYYDEYDVSLILKPGKNVIAIIATFYGEDMSWYEPLPNGIMGPKTVGKGSVIFQLEIPMESESMTVSSDKTTRGKICEAWDQTSPRINVGLPYMEKFDARKWNPEWLSLEYEDDSLIDWSHVIELVLGNSIIPLVKLDIPRLTETPVLAEKIITAGNWEPFFDDEDFAEPETNEQDQIDGLVQLGFSALNNNYQTLLDSYSPSNPEISLSLIDGPIGLVYDMGKTVSGMPFFSIESDSDDVILDIAWSEKIIEKNGVFVPDVNLWRTKAGLRYYCRKGINNFESFHWFGYRYLQINISGSISNVKIKKFGTVLYIYPVNKTSSFECSNPEWNQLFQTCVWTMQNCMHDGYEDCPSREQRQWVGDAYVETMVAYALFGETKLTKKLIDQTAQSQRGDNLTQMVTPGDSFIHGLLIPDYCLYYISTVYQYYRYTGDKDVLIEHLPVILRAIRWFLQFIHPITGLLTNVPQWIFIDWSSNDKWGANGVVNAQLYIVLKQIDEMVKIVQWGQASKNFNLIADKIKDSLNKFFWNSLRKGYVDAVDFDAAGKVIKISEKITFHVNTFMLLFDLTPADKINMVLENVFAVPNERLFVQNVDPIWRGKTSPIYRPETDVILAEPFFMHHVNQMLAKYERYDLIAKFFDEGWCEMIRRGATSIWETWGSHGSLCHAWCCTPGYDLLMHCLGLQILEPGAKKISIKPHPMGLSWAKGRIPTIKGPVEIEWVVDSASGNLELKYNVPDGIELVQ
jgi:hypothetical protein